MPLSSGVWPAIWPLQRKENLRHARLQARRASHRQGEGRLQTPNTEWTVRGSESPCPGRTQTHCAYARSPMRRGARAVCPDLQGRPAEPPWAAQWVSGAWSSWLEARYTQQTRWHLLRGPELRVGGGGRGDQARGQLSGFPAWRRARRPTSAGVLGSEARVSLIVLRNRGPKRKKSPGLQQNQRREKNFTTRKACEKNERMRPSAILFESARREQSIGGVFAVL